MATFWNKPRIVFFTWGMAELIGWLATHYWPDPRVNWVWLVLTVLAMIPMFMYMPWKNKKLRNILVLWVVVLVIGMAASFAAFMVEPLMWLPDYLGVFWLILMGGAFLVNALWWTPRLFVIGGVAQVVAGAAAIFVQPLLFNQYLVAAVVGSGAMFLLMRKYKS